MSQTYFSKQDPKEKESRLIQLGNSKGPVTIWVKGEKRRHKVHLLEFDKNRQELLLDTKEDFYPRGTQLLCSFELRGMFFFSEVVLNKSLIGNLIIEFKNELFKSEKRGSYRLLTFPIYEVFSEFDLSEVYEESGKIVDLKSRGQTALFKNFLKLIDNRPEEKQQISKFRIQDLSTSGMSLHIGEMETHLFTKDVIFKNVKLQFKDEEINIPQVKVVYVVDYITGEKNLKKYKVGFHFPELPTTIDEKVGGKINQLLREVDFNKDFENFTK